MGKYYYNIILWLIIKLFLVKSFPRKQFIMNTKFKNALKLFFLFNIILSLDIVFAKEASPDKEKVSINSVKKHLMVLSDDSLKGRGTGTEGGLASAKYIASKLEEYNLSPVGEDNSFYQQIQFRGVSVKPDSRFILNTRDISEQFYSVKDFLVYSSAVDPYFPKPLQMVFAGYGIIAPEYDYNDYQLINVEDKVVVILLGEPTSDDPEYFNGKTNTLYSSIEAKQRIALSRGAKGIVFIPNPMDAEYKEWDHYVQHYLFEEVYLAYSRNEIFSLIINPLIAEKLFTGGSHSFEDILKMEQTNSMKSFPLATDIALEIKVKARNFISPNVIALKEGSDPVLKNSYLILSAHYDHLGIGKAVNGDSVYNGFIDNASGVSALLEIARCLSEIETKRSVIFLFTTAEEKGLLGSTYYCDHPVFPLYKTIINVNIDGLAFIEDFTGVIGAGSEYSTLNEMLEEVLKIFNIKKTNADEILNRQESFSGSDQLSFAKAGVPSVIIVEDLDYDNGAIKKMINWMNKVYHSPFDDKNQFVNYKAMLKHMEIIFSFCKYMANVEDEPEWNSGTPFINIQLRNRAEKR